MWCIYIEAFRIEGNKITLKDLKFANICVDAELYLLLL